jgi:hypothetical protein
MNGRHDIRVGWPFNKACIDLEQDRAYQAKP